ncbi:MAG: hypothetical protein ACLSB9_27220 [Hydrogeniiclostridium mannosilyticum]
MVAMTGCGYCIRQPAMARSLLKNAGIPARVTYAVDASRHQSLDVLPKRERRHQVSGSGVVARVAEGLMRFQTKARMLWRFRAICNRNVLARHR